MALPRSARQTDVAGAVTAHELTHSLWLPATAFFTTNGSPSLSLYESRWGAWLLDGAGATEGVSAPFVVPSWATAHVDLYWTNASSGSGNVRFSTAFDNVSTGATLNASGSTTSVTESAPSQTLLKVSRILTGVTVTSKLGNVRVVRNSADALDTLANDIAIVGALLTRAS